MSEVNGGGRVERSKEPSGATVAPSEDTTDAATFDPQSRVREIQEG